MDHHERAEEATMKKMKTFWKRAESMGRR